MAGYQHNSGNAKAPVATIAAILLKAMVGADGKDQDDRIPVYWTKLSGIKMVQDLIEGRVLRFPNMSSRELERRIIQEVEERTRLVDYLTKKLLENPLEE